MTDLEGALRVESTRCGSDASRARLRRTPRGHAIRQSSTCSDKSQSIIDLDPKITDSTLELGVPEQPRVIMRISLSH